MSDLNAYEEGLAIDLDKAEARIEELEGKLVKVVAEMENLSQLITDQYADRLYTQTAEGWEQCGDDIKDIVSTTLAELKGQGDA